MPWRSLAAALAPHVHLILVPFHLLASWWLVRGFVPAGYELRTHRYLLGQVVSALTLAGFLLVQALDDTPQTSAWLFLVDGLKFFTLSVVAGRSAMVLWDFWSLARSVEQSASVWNAILRQRNLQRIQEARSLILLDFLLVVLNALHGWLRPMDDDLLLAQAVAMASLLMLICAFLLVILRVHQKHRREVRQLMLSGGISDIEAMESGLVSLASRSTAANLIVREVFYSEVWRIALTVAMAVVSRI